MKSEIDHEYTDEIVCPYCGHKFCNSGEWDANNLEASGLEKCDECEKEFEWSRGFEVWYNTKKIKDPRDEK